MLDFDTWVSIQRNDPERFESLRREIIDKEIRKHAKNSTDLWKKRGWWTRIELDMKVHKGAVGRMVAASKRMNEYFTKLNDQLQGFKND